MFSFAKSLAVAGPTPLRFSTAAPMSLSFNHSLLRNKDVIANAFGLFSVSLNSDKPDHIAYHAENKPAEKLNHQKYGKCHNQLLFVAYVSAEKYP